METQREWQQMNDNLSKRWVFCHCPQCKQAKSRRGNGRLESLVLSGGPNMYASHTAGSGYHVEDHPHI